MKVSLIEYAKKHQLWNESDRILVAVSGGRDSMALLHVLHSLNLSIGIAHINYHLRGNASDLDQELVENFAQKNDIPLFLKHADISATTQNTQLEARTIRYTFFDSIMQANNFASTATAHHLDDRVESLFLNLIRGTGIYGLNGIPVKRGKYIRPLLWASRADIDSYIASHNIPYRDDASNATNSYQRNRVRNEMIPLIESIDEQSITKLESSLSMLSEDISALKNMSETLLKKTGKGYDVWLKDLPNPSASTWLYHIMKPFGFNRQQAKDLLESTENGKKVIQQNWVAVKSTNTISILPAITDANKDLIIAEAGEFTFGSQSISITWKNEDPTFDPKNQQLFLNLTTKHFPLRIRAVANTDKFRPLGMSYDVSVKKFLQEKKVSPAAIADTLVVLTAQNDVCCIPGWQISEDFKLNENTRPLLSLSFKRNDN
ncbi:MAG: tRNA lysidine(34) synthetase TilS [Salibacteraceae bacterium]